MSTRYASFGTGIRRSPKTSAVQPWYRDSGALVLVDVVSLTSVAAFGNTQHDKHSYTELFASTTANTSLLVLAFGNVGVTATNTSTLADIAIGPAGSETVIVPNIAVGAHFSDIQIMLPVAIPSGSRVSFRLQSTRVSPATMNMAAALYAGNGYASLPSQLDVIGINTATSAGTAMSGASGTFTEITGTTAQDFQQIILVPSSSSTNIVLNTAIFELAVGAAGQEIVIGGQAARYVATEQIVNLGALTSGLLSGRPVPAGSRLSVRHNIAANSDRYNVCLIGVPYV